MAEHPKLVKLIGEATHSILRSEISLKEHESILKHHTKKLDNVKMIRPALQDSIFPLNENGFVNAKFKIVLDQVIGNIGRHGNGTSGHTYSCKKTLKGKKSCRYAKPSPPMNSTCGPILLYEEEIDNEDQIDDETENNNILKKNDKKKNEKNKDKIKTKIGIVDTSEVFPPKITFPYHHIGHDSINPFQPEDERVLLWSLQKREIFYDIDSIRVKKYLNNLNNENLCIMKMIFQDQ